MGVQVRIKQKQIAVIYTQCIAHRLELAIFDFIKRDNYLKEFDEGINNIFQFYFYSPARRRELHGLAKVMKDEFKQLRRLKNIRWIASRHRALKLLENDYKVLFYDLKSKSYGNGETSKKVKGYLRFLKNPHFLFNLHFFEDIVEQFKPLSLIFQSDSLLVCQVPRKLDECCCSLIDALAIAQGDVINRLMNNLTVNVNKEIVYEEVELKKPLGRAVENITHTPEAYNEHFTRKFE